MRLNFQAEIGFGSLAPPEHGLSLGFLWCEDAADRDGEAAPLLGFARKLLAASLGQLVKARFAIVGAGAPFGADPALGLQPLQCRVEGAVVDDQLVGGLLLNGES